MQKLLIQPISNMYQPFGFSFVKEAVTPAPVRGKTGYEKPEEGAQYALPGTGVDSTNPPSPAPVGRPSPPAGPAGPAGTADTAQPANKAQRVSQLEQQYHQTWNYFMSDVWPNLKNNVQQAQALSGLFDEVRPVWKSLRQQISQDPQFAEKLNDTYLEQAAATLTQASESLQRLTQSDTLLDNQIGDFQSQLTRAFNAIKQLSFDDTLAAPMGDDPATTQPATTQPGTEQSGGGVMNWMGNQIGKGVDWAKQQGRQFGQGYANATNAESDQFILTAQMGSAQSLIGKLG